jgi:hypothetical protein
MADKDHNRFESNKKWIEWKSVNNGGSLLHCQKHYNKPRDEEALKKKIKDKMKKSDERTRKRQGDTGPKRSQVKYSDGIGRVENHKKLKEWINLKITGSTSYKGRTFKKEVPIHGEQLMNRINKLMDYNQLYNQSARDKKTAANAMIDMVRGGKETNDGGITTSKDGKDAHNNNNCKPAAKPTAGVDDGGKEGVYLKDVVIEEGGADAVADGGRDDDNFEVDGNNLGQGKEETTLTDGAKDPVSNAGANNGSVDNMDEIGVETMLTDGTKDPVSNAGANNGSVDDMDEIDLIFDFDGKEEKVCLKEFGSYVKFNNKCCHKGYKTGKNTTFLSAQIFSVPKENRQLVKNNVANFQEGLLNEDDISRLKNISKDIRQGWKEKYKSNKHNAPKKFLSRKVN